MEISKILREYNRKNLNIATIGSHSALDVCDGASEEGIKTIIFAQKGREKPYMYYKKTKIRNYKRGCVDEILLLDKFKDMLNFREDLIKSNVIIVPNRALTSYISIDEVENFEVPVFGNRYMLRMEERTEKENYYSLLEKADLPYPKKIESPEGIDKLCMIKLPHAKKRLERGFFTVASYKEYAEKSEKRIKQGIITKEDLEKAQIEEYIIGPVFNLNFFYSPFFGLELLGADYRFESGLDGHVRLPAKQQLTLAGTQEYPEYTVCGHANATLRESLLEKTFVIGEKFVDASKKFYNPGIIGPFCLQTCVDKDLNFFIYDVAPRIGGGTNIHMNVGAPYGNTMWRKPMSTGRRIAVEIKYAAETDELEKVVT
ncbi:MAG: formate--phosphoribosylaminoimidazolecarboxamide ligase family protein [Candidatus Altiarchaeum hamiconexum]|uniref:Formate--phosphoribosylaminoimidazolecarboxamide ligase family protein n=1 Tax=Candidatus Altarchaeum hamiconexum TaxID=1803513 RepID=A0A8J7YUH6_9ARCH|nr:formate--phosphoribosylaminoimidazolecarboxamide ligase family protein [Candidatus Altarchaeum hamiconexum]OIQ04387.1 MAG: 5-formaminoimidazole-4-carboxamide-1-(beta)-D-ribofuranosyl 5'-monophosphate synthetase [Candidatus Altarchaeum sp. CG2_30_32_3053]PIN67944.1 MAG: 5-formaminoimidazole-4-carboxamide-1-(beta)-D-ribofuranosyl 5'-monophosphate synthetase [Candidatus Altarchaeum sp. CG12_big_fil_rev_8_21_14_0_65_33_22]PIV28609.1 MAG: 5-formaminoimidazole-4-carboxamide-1-(beta)-D-ribofuranosyl